MQEKLLFEYAVIRIVPRVEREEFLNVGIILYCKKRKFLECLTNIDTQRLHLFHPFLDIIEVEQYLKSIHQVCEGAKEAGTIGQMDIASRFRWLTATRSTVIQTSKVHPGFCTAPEETLQLLYEKFVL